MGENDSQGKSPLGYVAFARDFVIVAGFLLYLVGFVYYYAYLDRFGLSVSLADVPVYQLFVYAYLAITHEAWPFFLVGFGFVYFLYLLNLGYPIVKKQDPKLANQTIAAMATITTVIAIYLFAHLGVVSGVNDANAIKNVGVLGCAQFDRSTTGAWSVFVLSGNAIKKYPQRVLTANIEGRLQLVAETSEAYYVILHECPPKLAPKPIDSSTVFAIKKADVITFGTSPPD